MVMAGKLAHVMAVSGQLQWFRNRPDREEEGKTQTYIINQNMTIRNRRIFSGHSARDPRYHVLRCLYGRGKGFIYAVDIKRRCWQKSRQRKEESRE